MKIGSVLKSFERTYTLRQRTSESLVDGYVTQSYANDLTFKGVMVPAPATEQLEAVQSGIDVSGLSRLHVRLNQGALPLPEVNDIVLDPDGDEWVILHALDYEDVAGVGLYLVGRK